MLLLALDTSTELGSVAVLADGELRAEVAARVRGRHGETLLPMVREALRLAMVDKAELDRIAVGLGPGSFTGTRVGVATAKGLALALDLPIVGVGSLRAIARGAPAPRISVAVDAHKGEVYAAVYRIDGGALVEELAPFHATPDVARARLPEGVPTVGSGARRYPDALGALALPPIFDAVRASLIGLEAIELEASGGPADRGTLEPLYVRPTDATLPDAG